MSKQLDLDPTPVWERNMNAEQLEAIRHQDGPCALLAQAGSGKTRALVHRIARMVAEGTPADRILAVTFSKKAADEMNERLEVLGIDGARVGTWHSLCLQIIKDGTPWEDWALDDKDRAAVLVKDVIGYRHLDWKGADAGQMVRYIGVCKAHLASPDSDEAFELTGEFFDGAYDQGMASRAYALYEVLREERGMLTFDDFLVCAHRWLKGSEAERTRWASKWTHLLVDEAQDNNPAQQAMQRHLAKDHRNIMVVGDVAQAIYGFRGSSPRYLAEFAQEWDAKTIIMNRNYRSGGAIVNVANLVIGPAEVRLPTDMLAERPCKGLVEVRPSEDAEAEGEAFADWVYERVNSGQPLESICALYRTNAQSRALEEALLKKRIPYVVVGGTSFYERKEVKGLLAYLRVATGRDDDGESVRRCINAPFRYLGAKFYEKLGRVREGTDWTMRVEKAAEESGIQKRQKASAQEWAGIIRHIKATVEGEDGNDEAKEAARPAAILNDLVHQTGYIDWLEKDEGGESIESSHAANVREMCRIAERFGTVTELLDYIEDMGRAARKQRGDRQAGGSRVLLMSCHRSKGLEWPNVWVNGCNEKVLPHAKGDLEEERRLMYVATTRARDTLVFSYVRKHATRDGVKDALPSRFLRDARLVA